jgi:DNA-binding GntR family transcriptional regulator
MLPADKYQQKSLKGSSRGDSVYLAVRRAIIEQALKPGDKLPEDVIGDRFGVSRTIVRAVLARLQSEGLVELRPNRGATVAQPSLSEAHDIFEARRCLERQVVMRLGARITEQDLKLLSAHLKLEELASHTDPAAAIRLAGEFHILLAELAGNVVLARYVDELVSRCSLILAIYGRPHSSECSISEHQQVLAALGNRDADLAVSVMDHHLEAVNERALLSAATQQQRDIGTILDRYAR